MGYNNGAHILGAPKPDDARGPFTFPHLNAGKPITLRQFLDETVARIAHEEGGPFPPDDLRVMSWMFFYGAGSFLKVMDKLNGCIANRTLNTAQAELVMGSLRLEIASVLTKPLRESAVAAPQPESPPPPPPAAPPGAFPPGSFGGVTGLKIAEHNALDGTKVMILTRSMWIVPSEAIPLIAGAAKDGVLSPEDIKTALAGYKLIDLTRSQ